MKIWKLILFLTFSVVAPTTYMVLRFNLFSETKMRVGIGGIIVFAIMLGTISALIKYYLAGMKTKYSFLKQLLQGMLRVVLPLVIALFVVIFLSDNMSLVKEALIVLIPSELIAIIFNPFPKWCFDNNVEGLGEIAEKIFKKKGAE